MNKQRKEDPKQKNQLISSLILKIHQMNLVQLRQFVFVANCLLEGIDVAELRLLKCQEECDRLQQQVNRLNEIFSEMADKPIRYSRSAQ